MRHGLFGSGMSLIGGSAVGAALMYLFDPEKGEKRREYIASHAGGALRAAGDRIGGTWHDVAGHARDLGEALTEHATRLADQAGDAKDSAAHSASDITHQLAGHARRLGKAIADKAHEYTSAAGDYAGQAKDYAASKADDYRSQARDVTSRARGYASDARDYASSWGGESSSSSHAAGYTLSAAGAVALGLGALWLFDRAHGEDRRRMVSDKFSQYLGDTGSAFRSTGEYLARQVNGVVSEVKSHLGYARDEFSNLSANPGGPYGAPEGGEAPETGRHGAYETGGQAPLTTFDQSHTVRLGIGVAGGALGFYGATRRDWVGMSMGLLGLSMVACGLTAVDFHAVGDRARRYGSTLGEQAGHLGEKAGQWGAQVGEKAGQWGSQARDMASHGVEAAKGLTAKAGLSTPTTVNKSIEINASVDRVFEFWTNYSNFPSFMSNLKEVTDLGNGKSHWVAKGPAGVSASWDAQETQRVENQVLSWESVPGSTVDNRGTVRFQPLGENRARVDVELSYTPPAGKVGDAVARLFGADPNAEMDQDLKKLKEQIESGTTANA